MNLVSECNVDVFIKFEEPSSGGGMGPKCNVTQNGLLTFPMHDLTLLASRSSDRYHDEANRERVI